jgi:hypothetical protein
VYLAGEAYTSSLEMAEPCWVYLFGNGLSLMFNREHYSLPNLTKQTRRVLDSLPGLRSGGGTLLTELEEIQAGLATDEQRYGIGSFEQLAGALDRLSNVLSEVGPLAQLASEDAQEIIRALWSQLRILYKRVVGIVLRGVMSHADGHGEWGYLHEVARHLADKAIHQREIDVFTLNYDALLDAALITMERERRGTNVSFQLMDEFDGRQFFEVPVLTPNEEVVPLKALAWRVEPFAPDDPQLRLHHLHGAGTWMRYQDTIYKAANLQAMRACRIYESWVEGIEGQEEEGFVEPVVLLGDQKETSVGRRPFDATYEELIRALTEATHIAIAGYGFQDLPLNRILHDYRGDAEVLIVTTGVSDARLRDVFGIPRWSRQFPDWLTVDWRGLPEGLVSERVPDLPLNDA